MEPVWVWTGEEFMVGVVFGMRHLLFQGAGNIPAVLHLDLQTVYTVYSVQCTVYTLGAKTQSLYQSYYFVIILLFFLS